MWYVVVRGDCYDRYLVRMEEMRQSIRILHQCISDLPPGIVKVGDYKLANPPRLALKSNMEALIHHFKYYSEGYSVERGSTFVEVEAPNVIMGSSALLLT
jgi:NADH dehydrogenase (ubiquinone) Fe-S protein 2